MHGRAVEEGQQAAQAGPAAEGALEGAAQRSRVESMRPPQQQRLAGMRAERLGEAQALQEEQRLEPSQPQQSPLQRGQQMSLRAQEEELARRRQSPA